MNIIYFDLETTGLSITRDRIVEIGFIYNDKPHTLRLNPTIPISKEASRVHNIYDNDVVDCKTFKDISIKLYNIFESADIIIGYNSDVFDIPFLEVEFLRCGLVLTPKPTLDIFKLWKHLEPDQKLSTCYRRFVGKELKDAHSAEADIEGTKICLDKIMDMYNLSLSDSVFYSYNYKKKY